MTHFQAPPLQMPHSNENFKPSFKMDEDQQKVFEELKAEMFADETLDEEDIAFLTDSCLVRYLRAREFVLKASREMLYNSLKWRKEYKPHKLSPLEKLDLEAETGKMIRHGTDLQGRPCIFMRPRYQNTTNYEEQTKLTVYMLEKAMLTMNPELGVEKLVLFLDFKDYSLRNAPPMSQSREVLSILLDHCPERLGDAFIVDAPRFFSFTFSAISPFMPTATKEKIHFVSGSTKEDGPKREMFSKYFDMKTFPKEYGGDLTVSYDHDKCWSQEKEEWEIISTQNWDSIAQKESSGNAEKNKQDNSANNAVLEKKEE